MSVLYERRERLESATKAAEMVQKDDIIIFLWSYQHFVHKLASTILSLKPTHRVQLFNLLGGSKLDGPYWKFYSEHVKNPISGTQILLISMPNFWPEAARGGVEHLLAQIEKRHAKIIAHIWVHDILRSHDLTRETPWGWDYLQEVIEGSSEVGMATVTFLSTGWERVSLEMGQKSETGIMTALRDDVKQGLLFEWLEGLDESQAWKVIQEIIESNSSGARALRRERGPETFKFMVVRTAEDRRVTRLQRELDTLYVELERTEYGREICTKFKKVAIDQKKTMEPLVEKLDGEDLEPEEKEQLEKMVAEEYMLFLRQFRGYFAEIRAMRIEIGRNLRDFYGLLEPKKKRLGLF